MSARERGKKKNTLIFPSAQDGILLFHYRLAVYISLLVTYFEKSFPESIM